MTPLSLLEQVDRLLAEVVPVTRGSWPRACAWMTRQALEGALDDYWAAARPQIVQVSRRSQLLILHDFVGPDLARRVDVLWHQLSRAGHNHAYELSPTAAELRAWEQQTRSVVSDLGDARARVRP